MQIVLTEHFEADVEYYRRKKKYRKIGEDIEPVLLEIEAIILSATKLKASICLRERRFIKFASQILQQTLANQTALELFTTSSLRKKLIS